MSIREHMTVVGNDGAIVGKVDRVEGGRIKLTKQDNQSGHKDHHHFIDCELVDSIDDDQVRLSVSADAVPKYEEDGHPV